MNLIDLFLHLDKHLADFTTAHGSQTYALLFGIVFAETGLVVTPFLPGDSLLFAAGATSALGSGGLKYPILFATFMLAAFLGDNVNYFAGKLIGRRLFRPDSRFLSTKHLEQTEAFFKKYGARAVIIARFVPIVRTFSPFVAGMGAMDYPHFLLFSFLGSLLWVGVALTSGYFFGNIPIVQHNFSLVILAVVALSLLPLAIEYIRHRQTAKEAATADR